MFLTVQLIYVIASVFNEVLTGKQKFFAVHFSILIFDVFMNLVFGCSTKRQSVFKKNISILEVTEFWQNSFCDITKNQFFLMQNFSINIEIFMQMLVKLFD